MIVELAGKILDLDLEELEQVLENVQEESEEAIQILEQSLEEL